MAEYNINPFGNSAEFPDGYPIADNLTTNSAQQALSARMGKKLNEKMSIGTIIVAAANTPSDMKAVADYVCTGTHDEVTLNSVIAASTGDSKRVVLLRGDYYLDAPTKTYSTSNDTFLLADLSPQNGAHGGLFIYGEDPKNLPYIHISNSAYEALSSEKQYSLLAIKNTENYGGFVILENIRLVYPWNQKKVCALDMYKFGGNARLHTFGANAYTNGYNGQTVNVSTPPPAAVEGCIGVRFVAKGPSGIYGNEIIDSSVSGFNEGWCINTEWCLCNHVGTNLCVTGWVFGKYRNPENSQVAVAIHPILLLNCSDERGVNLPIFYSNSGLQDIEMYAFSIERTSNIVPGGTLGYLARVISSGQQGEFRGVVNYTVQNHEQGAKNSGNIGFWEYGHGHGMRTTDMSHNQAGTTTERMSYRPNYMQRFWDTSLGKEVICYDENPSAPVWKDAAGNVVSNS